MQTVLVVDDDPHIREVVCFALKQEGYATTEAESGAEAMKRSAADTPALIVLDIMMPEMGGTEVCRELRKHSNVPILFLSSRDDEVDRIIGLELGGDDYVTKPFSPRKLVARAKRSCGVRRTRQGEDRPVKHIPTHAACSMADCGSAWIATSLFGQRSSGR